MYEHRKTSGHWEAMVASHKLNLGDGDSVLSLLYEACCDINRM